jgi:hypothetical protein
MEYSMRGWCLLVTKERRAVSAETTKDGVYTPVEQYKETKLRFYLSLLANAG